MSAPVLAHPDFKKPFTIMSDGSGKGIGAVLMQENDQGQLTAVAYFSKALTPAQKNYAQCEIETLALLCALELWAPYFSGTTIRCMVDCEAVRYLLRPDSKYTGRQLRWLLRLSSFDIDLQMKTSKQNIIADFLSRHPVKSEYGNHLYGVVGPLHPSEQPLVRGGVIQNAQEDDRDGVPDITSPRRPNVMVSTDAGGNRTITDKGRQRGLVTHPDREVLLAARNGVSRFLWLSATTTKPVGLRGTLDRSCGCRRQPQCLP